MTHQLLLVESLLATVHIITESSQPVVQHLHVAVQDRTLTQIVKLKQKHNKQNGSRLEIRSFSDHIR